MKRFIFPNGLKLIYEHRQGSLTSFCIGYDGGALREDKNIGVAHALEHMLFKGTSTLNEKDINTTFDNIFGFNNAMTNFPYAIYYGTTINENFQRAFSFYMDILLNPKLDNTGFKEEMEVILQESREWKEDFDQYCEDLLLFNAFHKRRIKYNIIGEESHIKNIELDDLINYYEKYYVPNNAVISVVTSLDFQEVYSVVNKVTEGWKSKELTLKPHDYEVNKNSIFYNELQGFNGAKIQYIFDISFLDSKQIEILHIFNTMLGQGLSSILFDEIRTKKGWAYDVGSFIKEESGIKLFTIKISTSKEHYKEVINCINDIIDNIKDYKHIYDKNYKHYINRLKIKSYLDIEKSIELSKKLTTNEIMNGYTEDLNTRFEFNEQIQWEEVIKTMEEVIKTKSIQVMI